MVMEGFRCRIIEISSKIEMESRKDRFMRGKVGRRGGGGLKKKTRATGGARGRDTDTGEGTGIHSPQDK